MKAIVINNNWLKSVDEMVVDNNAPEPKLGDNQVLVEIKAAALNFFDILQVSVWILSVVNVTFDYYLTNKALIKINGLKLIIRMAGSREVSR